MALDDGTKDVLGWAILVPGFLRMVGDMTGEKGFGDAADKLSSVPVDKIAEIMGALRTDHVNIESGTMSIGDGVEVEVIDG